MKKKGSLLHNANFQGLLVLLIIIGVAAFWISQNKQSSQKIGLPMTVPPTADTRNSDMATLFSRPPATPTSVDATFAAPTIPVDSSATPEIFQVTVIRPQPRATSTALPTAAQTTTIEFVGSTPVPSPTGVDQSVFNDDAVAQFQPPPEDLPLSLQPFDHFYFRRPVDASANSRSIFYYPYGARWVGSTSRVHHGVDMPNDIGQEVLSGWSGTVVWAGSVATDSRDGDLELYESYGRFVVIEHDFSIQGQSVWTLYAHLSAILVEAGAQVDMGDVIGLVGDTGFVTGAHVHFEVRIGKNSYWNTRNPLLWIVPYLNHGVVAGRIVDPNGQFIDEVAVQITRGGRIVDQTVTYAQPLGGRETRYHVIPDDNWGENFALGDVPAGQYQIAANVDGRRFQELIDVKPGQVNWVEFQVNPPEPTSS